ncbi:hypothetical protein BDP27DRAFT_1424851 [Rhodocollybia butyracea]|uniref:Uncharacterized protein n=1 Tax=Rhodocollybia butyracea TaxID=206335 RepID=A0A9P5PL65_9AGAR|nr:hypothetical protein BDP27DRAFT_1424851 [Rhodocollybia butyracea]
MAEVLGTASSIIALVDECEDVAQELCLLNVYATRLRGLVSLPHGDANDAWTSSLRQLDGRPPKGKLGLLKRHALSIVEKEEVQELLTCISRSMVLLKAAIELDHLKLSLAIKEDLDTVRAGVDIIRSDVNTIRTQNVKQLETGALKRVFKFVGGSNAAFVKRVASHDVWKRIGTQYRKGSAYILPKSYDDYLEYYPEISNRFEIVKLTDDGSNLDSVLYRHMSYILDCILWADGISIAWKALYDISIRSADSGPNLDLLALFNAHTGKLKRQPRHTPRV